MAQTPHVVMTIPPEMLSTASSKDDSVTLALAAGESTGCNTIMGGGLRWLWHVAFICPCFCVETLTVATQTHSNGKTWDGAKDYIAVLCIPYKIARTGSCAACGEY
jgi:hypothetical protein